MATATLVDNIFEEGKNFLKYLDKQHLDIKVAFWLYQKETNSWKFIFSIPNVEQLGSRFFYAKILRQLNTFNFQFGRTLISPLDVVILPYSDNLIKLLKSKVTTSPAPSISTIRLSNNVIDGTLIDDILIYRLV